jgi:hydrogenase maturation protease
VNLALAEAIVKAVLYEGYLLYPYRPTALKNQQRWTFGGIYPQAFTEPWSAQTECLCLGGPRTELDVRVRFLHLQDRAIGEIDAGGPELCKVEEPAFHFVERLQVGGRTYYAWQEAVEREASALNLSLVELTGNPRRIEFDFPARQEAEILRNPAGEIAGQIVRRQQAIQGAIEVAAEIVAGKASNPPAHKVSVRISNTTTIDGKDPFSQTRTGPTAALSRDQAALWAFVSTHALVGARDGEFVSLFDPPEALREAADQCRNVGTWPVLVGVEGERDLVLSSPIILYDYPQIAPESAGDLFDGTEIDELLTLRILTLTEEEKQEMRQADERGRELLDRSESLPPETIMRMHGALRSLRRPGEAR